MKKEITRKQLFADMIWEIINHLQLSFEEIQQITMIPDLADILETLIQPKQIDKLSLGELAAFYDKLYEYKRKNGKKREFQLCFAPVEGQLILPWQRELLF